MRATSFRLPSDTLDTITRLRLPGESQAAVIARAVALLAEKPMPLSPDEITARLTDVERRVTALESASNPARVRDSANSGTTETTPAPKAAPSERGYSADVKALAIRLKDEGRSQSDICDEIERVAGKRPHPKNISRQIEQWRAAA